jgi:hypothetical protein
MPKVPNHELGRYLDPESEEYSPTKDELEDDDKFGMMIREEIYDIEEKLKHPKKDRFTGEEIKFGATDPEMVWDRLMYLQTDYLDKIKDKKLQKQFKEEILKLEQKVYKQYVPFIETKINYFGWQNSPLEEKYGGSRQGKVDAADIVDYFKQARATLEHFKLPKEQGIDYLSDLNRLEEKLDRYRSETTLFTFEEGEERLHKELFDFEYGDFYFGHTKESARGLDDKDTQKENVLKFDLWLAKAHSLQEIAGRMLHASIASDCLARAKGLLERAEYFKALSESPRELFGMEAELKDLKQRIKNGEQPDAMQLDGLMDKLAQIKEKRLGLETARIIEKLTKLAEKLKGAQAGEDIDDEEAGLGINFGEADWAWKVLGIDKNSSQEELKKAYHNLALKNHPDFNKSKEAKEKMIKINEAVDFVRRVKGYK